MNADSREPAEPRTISCAARLYPTTIESLVMAKGSVETGPMSSVTSLSSTRFAAVHDRETVSRVSDSQLCSQKHFVSVYGRQPRDFGSCVGPADFGKVVPNREPGNTP